MSPWFKWAGIAAGSALVVVVGYVVYVVLVVLDDPFDNRVLGLHLGQVLYLSMCNFKA